MHNINKLSQIFKKPFPLLFQSHFRLTGFTLHLCTSVALYWFVPHSLIMYLMFILQRTRPSTLKLSVQRNCTLSKFQCERKKTIHHKLVGRLAPRYFKFQSDYIALPDCFLYSFIFIPVYDNPSYSAPREKIESIFLDIAVGDPGGRSCPAALNPGSSDVSYSLPL